LLTVTAAAALSVARPALGNLIGDSSNASQAGEFAGLTAHSSLFQTLLESPSSGHFSRMLETMSDRTSVVTFTLPNMDRDLLRLNVIQITLRGDLENLLWARRSSDNERGRITGDHFPKPVGKVPAPSDSPNGVTVPDGGSTVLLLGLALLGFAALRRRLSF
jgi:VPDSG-CTERM motif